MADQTEFGAFVATSNIFNTQEMLSLDPQSKEFIVKLQQRIDSIARTLNIKCSGYYPLTEFVTGELYFPDPTLTSFTGKSPTYRPVYCTVVDFGTLPNTATKTVAHGITVTNTFSFVRIYATATDPIGLTSIPISYASPVLANNIEISVDNTNVIITTGVNRTAYTTCFAVLKYIKE